MALFRDVYLISPKLVRNCGKYGINSFAHLSKEWVSRSWYLQNSTVPYNFCKVLYWLSWKSDKQFSSCY